MLKTLRFGIEIETIGLHRDALARAIASVLNAGMPDTESATDQRGRTWRVVRDGSLSQLASGEIVSPILTYDDIPLLQDIIRAVRHAGARVDESCGIHIHIDGAQFDARSVRNLVNFVYRQEALLEHALALNPHRRDNYCKPIDERFIERLARKCQTLSDVRDAWYGVAAPNPSRYHSSRYRGLNLNSLFYRGTIEFRYFNGTLHAGEVKGYLQLCLAIAAKALATKASGAKRRTFNPATARYDLRVVLLGLGLIGEEFATARKHLTKRLAGSSSWKHGRPSNNTTVAVAA